MPRNVREEIMRPQQLNQKPQTEILSFDGNLHLHCSHLSLLCADSKVVKIPAAVTGVLALFLIWIWRTTWHRQRWESCFQDPSTSRTINPLIAPSEWQNRTMMISTNQISDTLHCLWKIFPFICCTASQVNDLWTGQWYDRNCCYEKHVCSTTVLYLLAAAVFTLM